MVLDAKGKWAPMAQPLAVERGVLRHLEAGEVMHEGKWVPIAHCLAARSANGAALVGSSSAQSHDAEHISNKKGIPWVVVSCSTGEQHLAPGSLLPLIRQSGAHLEGNGDPDPWDTDKGLPLHIKTIALAAASLVAVGLVVWVVVKVFF